MLPPIAAGLLCGADPASSRRQILSVVQRRAGGCHIWGGMLPKGEAPGGVQQSEPCVACTIRGRARWFCLSLPRRDVMGVGPVWVYRCSVCSCMPLVCLSTDNGGSLMYTDTTAVHAARLLTMVPARAMVAACTLTGGIEPGTKPWAGSWLMHLVVLVV
jgi:hypothetical protein